MCIYLVNCKNKRGFRTMKEDRDILLGDADPFWSNIVIDKEKKGELNKLEIMKRITFFSDLTKKELSKVSPILYELKFQEEEYLFEMNQPGAALFIITRGVVSITIPGNNQKAIVLASLKPGDFVGELALLDDSPRSASAQAAQYSEALAFFRADFSKLIKNEPVIGGKILKRLANVIGERLKAKIGRAHV